ncbi:AsmA family protein [Marinilabiliaceae bacterium JC017]|nr:AsmA family protein [Marinilabiliaceae bacterium JC017]
MKKALRLFEYFLITVFSLIIILIVVAKLTEDKITKYALGRVSKVIEAPLEVEDVSFTFLKRFPLATVEFNGIRLGSPNVFNAVDSLVSVSDTLVNIDKVYISVETMPLINGDFKVMKVEVMGADFNYMVDTRGRSNFDFLMDTTQTVQTDTASSDLNLLLKELSLSEISCHYMDSSLSTAANFFIPNLQASGKFANGIFEGATSGNIKLSDCSFKKTNLCLMKETDVVFNLVYANNVVSFNDVDVKTDGARLAVSGSVDLTDTIAADISVKGTEINAGELLKYVPRQMLKEYGIKAIAGKMNFNGLVKGNVTDSIMPQVNVSFAMKNGAVVTAQYPKVKNISFGGQMTNGDLRNNKTTSIVFDKFHFETEQSKGDVSFSVRDIDQLKYDVTTNLQLNLEEFETFIPDTVVQNVNGQINASLSTKGVLPDSIGDDFIDYLLNTSRATIDLSDLNVKMDSALSIDSLSGQLVYLPGQIQVNNVKAEVPAYHVNIKNTSMDALWSGSVTQLQTMGVDVKAFHLETDSCLFTGSGMVQDLERPGYRMNGKAKLCLDEIKTMLPDTLVKHLAGEVTASFSSAGTLNLDSIEDQMNDLLFESSRFNMELKNVSVEMPDTLMRLDDFYGKINLQSDTLSINQMKGQCMGIDFNMDSTKIVNVNQSILKKDSIPLFIEGVFRVGDVDMAVFDAFMEADADTVQAEVLPEESTDEGDEKAVESMFYKYLTDVGYQFQAKGKFTLHGLHYGKIQVKNISSLFNVTNSAVVIDQFKFEGFKGRMNSSVNCKIASPSETVIVMRNTIEGMDISQLLQDFDDFKDYQSEITHEQISGVFSGHADSYILMMGDDVVTDEMNMKADLRLENGGLFDYKRATDMSGVSGVKELDNMQFKTIDSKVFVFNDAIFVPKTDVKSNSLDVTVIGKQSFGGDYQYHVGIFPRQILFGKSKRSIRKQEEKEESGKKDELRPKYVRAEYINGKEKNVLDNQDLRKIMQATIFVQERKLKSIFFPRLFDFKTGVKDLSVESEKKTAGVDKVKE